MAKRKTKKIEEKKFKVFITYDETRSGGDKIDPNDRWSNRELEDIDFTPIALYAMAKGEYWVETIEVDFDPQKYIGKKIDVVLVRYSDGDTFGRTDGHWYAVGAYPAETKDAGNVAKAIELNKYTGDYLPWNGYFARLSWVDIHSFTLQEIIVMSETPKTYPHYHYHP